LQQTLVVSTLKGSGKGESKRGQHPRFFIAVLDQRYGSTLWIDVVGPGPSWRLETEGSNWFTGVVRQLAGG
jgi:hypothetical protein